MIRIENLEFSYPKRKVLQGISLEIPDGNIFGILGPNGSGKTTLFRILSTSLQPERGAVTWLGYDLARESAAVRGTLGVVFQSPSLDPHLTVEENLCCHGALYGLSGQDLKNRIQNRLIKLGVLDRSTSKVKELSGGLKRRVELAKALLHDPKVLILDEPSTGLDPRARAELWDFLMTINHENKTTILVTTHLMEEAEKCSRVVILDQGKVIAEGAPAILKAGLGTGFISIDTAEPDNLSALIENKFGIKPAKISQGLRVEHEAPRKLIAELMEAFPLQINTIAFHKPSLEDVFLKKTGRTFEDQTETKNAKNK